MSRGRAKSPPVLTIEGGEAIEERPENLRLFHELGVKAMTLTWNYRNELASPAMARRDKGLQTALAGALCAKWSG